MSHILELPELPAENYQGTHDERPEDSRHQSPAGVRLLAQALGSHLRATCLPAVHGAPLTGPLRGNTRREALGNMVHWRHTMGTDKSPRFPMKDTFAEKVVVPTQREISNGIEKNRAGFSALVRAQAAEPGSERSTTLENSSAGAITGGDGGCAGLAPVAAVSGHAMPGTQVAASTHELTLTMAASLALGGLIVVFIRSLVKASM